MSSRLSAHLTPMDRVKGLCVEIGEVVEKVVERLVVDLVKNVGKYLYQQIRFRLKRPKHHAVDAGPIYWSFSLSEPKVTLTKATDTKAVD